MKEENKKRGRGRPKKKKVEDENINEEELTDINEEDDTFGLPDIDLKPLDEVEEVTDEPEEQVEEEVIAENSGIEEEFEEQTSEDDTQDTLDDQGEDQGVDSEGAVEDEVQPAFTKRYEYEESKSSAPKIIGAIVGVLIIVAGVYYFGFYAPEQKAAAEKAAQEQAIASQKAEEARQQRLEQERLAQQQEGETAQAIEEEEAAKPTPGEINILTEPTGRYYVVIGSFIDDDLAMDYGHVLAEEGTGSMILSPTGKTKFYRLALSDHGSWNEAQQEANSLKSDYSDALWVLKY